MDKDQVLNQSHEIEPGSVKLPQGEVGKRSRDKRTDTFMIPIFLLITAFTILLFLLYVPQGNYGLADKVLDSEARVCGVDEAVKKYPYLYMVNFEKNYRSVCVAACPQFDYNQIIYNSTGSNKTSIQPLLFEDLGTPSGILFFREDDNETVFQFDEYLAQNKYDKDRFENYVSRYNLDCSINNDINTCKHDKSKGMFIYDSRLVDNKVCVPVSPRIRLKSTILNSLVSQEPFEISDGKWAVVFCVGTGLLLSILFGAMVSCCMTCMLWTGIILGGICAILVGGLLMLVGLQGSNPYVSPVLEAMSMEPFIIGRVAGYIKTQLMLMFLGGLSLVVIAIAMPITAIVRHRAVRNSALLLESGHAFIVKRRAILAASLVGFLAVLLGVTFLYFGDYGIYFSGNLIRDPVVGYPFSEFNFPIYKRFLMWLFVLGALWLILSIANLLDWTTTDAAILDYYNANEKPVQESLKNVVPHIGSVLLGGALFLPLAIVRVICAPFFLLFSIPGNHQYWIKIKQIACWNSWYYKYVLRLNEQAYAIQALTGEELVPSAKLFHHLEARHDKTVPYSYTIIFGFSVAGAIFVTLFNQWIAYSIVSRGWLGSAQLKYTGSTYHFIFLFTLVQSLVFMRLLYSAALGIGGCYYFQLDRKEEIKHDIMKRVNNSDKADKYVPLVETDKKKQP
jgi:hypothetical protein